MTEFQKYIQRYLDLIPSENWWEELKISGNKTLETVSYTHLDVYKRQAFLPDFPDYLKMNYTQKQYEWAIANEANIWNFFVENNLVFSDDTRLGERFIKPGPFSKFYTEIDNDCLLYTSRCV